MRSFAHWLLVIGFSLLILGGKFWLIDRAGTDLPVLDQWDGEGNMTLRPWYEHRLTFHEIGQPHNEHRIVTAKLFALGLAIAKAAAERQGAGLTLTMRKDGPGLIACLTVQQSA